MSATADDMEMEYEPDRRDQRAGRRDTDRMIVNVADHEARITALERSVSRLVADIEVNITNPLQELVAALMWMKSVTELCRKVFCPVADAFRWVMQRLLVIAAVSAALIAAANEKWDDAIKWLRGLL